MVLKRLLWCFAGGFRLLASSDVYVKPEISETMEDRVYAPIAKLWFGEVPIEKIPEIFKLCERSYAAYLINADADLYTISGKIWDKLSGINNGTFEETLVAVDKEVKKLYQRFVRQEVNEEELYAQCDKLVEEALKGKTE